MAEGEIEIVLEGEPPVTTTADSGTPPSVVQADDPSVGIEDLKRQLAEKASEAKLNLEDAARARADASAAEARRQEALRQAEQARAEAQTANAAGAEAAYDSIINGLSAAQQEAEALAAAKAKAMGEGDFEKASKLDIDIAKVGAKIVRLEDGKETIEAERKAPKQQPRQQPQPTETDRREQYIQSKSQATQQWLRAHPEFFTDTKLQGKITSAHGYLVEHKGLRPDTPEYFKEIEIMAGMRKADDAPVAADPVSRAAEPVRSAPTPAAPVSRTVPSATPGAPGGAKIMLTAEEVQIAKQMFTEDIIGKGEDPLVHYARQKAQLQKEGRVFRPQ